MMSEQDLFVEAMDRQDPGDRSRYLDEACQGDAALRERVERLIQQSGQLGSFLDHPPSEAAAIEAGAGGKTDCETVPTIVLGNGSTCDDEGHVGYAGQPDMRQNPQEHDDQITLGYLQPPLRHDSLGRLGHYEVLEVIGRGAFGTVLRAFDERLERIVAVKVLAPEMAAASPARKRFLREARTSAQIRHENVVAIHAVEDEPIPYLVMEYIPGETLQQRLDEHGPLDLPDVLRLGKQIADGLAAAHARDLIHRDVKPGNVLLDTSVNDHVKITDFGLARTIDDASMTQSGLIAGTPLYMAPEQALGHKLDQRADLFSFGSVLYQMLTGRPPFRASSTIAVLKRVTEDTPRPIQEIIPEVPDWMCALVGHLHAKQPDERYGSAKVVSTLLAKCLADVEQGRTPSIPAPGRPADEADSPAEKVSVAEQPQPRSVKHAARWPLLRTAALLLIVLLAGLGISEATGVSHLATTIIRLTTGSGTLVIESNDPGVKIAIDGEEVTITGGGVESLTLRPGDYTVTASKNGRTVKQELVTITRNGQTVVRMSLEPAPKVANTSGTQSSDGWHGWATDAPPPAIAPFDAAQAKAHQEAWAKYLGVPVEYTNSIGMKFRLIPPGEFLMGSTPAEIEAALMVAGGDANWQGNVRSEGPRHKVLLTIPAYLSVDEVRQQDYVAVIGNNPSFHSINGSGLEPTGKLAGLDTSRLPVENVSWNAAAEFCSRLSELEGYQPLYLRSGDAVTLREGKGYRLPTEAEWEFACRAGTTTRFWCGDDDSDIVAVGWVQDNSGGRSHRVGELTPNPFGLYDMHGNVWEWVQDWWSADAYSKSNNQDAIDPTGPPSGLRRVIRGGHFSFIAAICRSSDRYAEDPTSRRKLVGFRVALSVDSVRLRIGERAGTPHLDAPKPAIAPFKADEAQAHQQAWADYLGVTVEKKIVLGQNKDGEEVTLTMVLIPPGEFLMGATDQEQRKWLDEAKALRPNAGDDEFATIPMEDQHFVRITKPFWISKEEFTKGQFRKFVEGSDGYKTDAETKGQGGARYNYSTRSVERKPELNWDNWANPSVDRNPVVNVSWNDAAKCCEWLSSRYPDLLFSLPTEAQWEFACRAGTRSSTYDCETSEQLREYAQFGSEVNFIQRGRQLRPNAFGLHDMLGNVTEWCSDWLAGYGISQTDDPAGPSVPGKYEMKAVRGGSFIHQMWRVRSSKRDFHAPDDCFFDRGFRVVAAIRDGNTTPAVGQATVDQIHLWPADAPPPAIAPFKADEAQAHQDAWAKYLGVPVEYTNSIGMKFRLIPPGEFLMGSTPEEIEAALVVAGGDQNWRERINSEAPQHKVIVTQPVYFGATEVTQTQYEQVMETNPSAFAPLGDGKEAVAGLETGNYPVEMVGWNDAAEFCARLSQREELEAFDSRSEESVAPQKGTGYRLPTEAEWEFACRAGTTTRFWSGDQDNDLIPAGWFGRNPGGRTRAVGELRSNPFGLFDVHRNVWEWVQDNWDPAFYARFQENPAVGSYNPFDALSERVIRGGDWGVNPTDCRSSTRSAGARTYRAHAIGFRVVLPVAAVKERPSAPPAIGVTGTGAEQP